MSREPSNKPRVTPKMRRGEAAIIAGEDVFEWLVTKWAFEPDPEMKWERGMALLPWVRARPTQKPAGGGELVGRLVIVPCDAEHDEDDPGT